MTLTHERLCEMLDYDPQTGVFHWRQNVGKNKYKRGDVAGHQDASGYVKIGLDGVRYYAHRLAWFCVFKQWPRNNIDHVDRCRSNNRILNLRDVGQTVNGLNGPVRRNNSSGYNGVTFDPRRGHWTAYITVARKRRYLGAFADIHAAKAARQAAEASIMDRYGKG